VADRYLIETSSTDGYLLEDGSGVLLIEGAEATVVTPTTASLTTETFAPTVTASDHKLVTPTTASLTTATFAPTVSTPRLVTPSTASLSLSAFAPSVNVGVRVTPETAELATAGFAPTVTVSDNITVTPVTATLTLTTFAPTARSHGLAIRVEQGTLTPVVEGQEVVVVGPTQVPAGSNRRRYVLPDGRHVLATRRDVERLLEQFLEPEVKRPKLKKKAAVVEAMDLVDITPQIVTVKIPTQYAFKPDPKTYEEALRAIQRRLDDEEAILLLI
jgi:hypothetical protein